MTFDTRPSLAESRSRDHPAISVSQLNRLVAQLLEGTLPLQVVRGEISNFVRAASGHWYFSLKDAGAQVRAVMFRGRSQQVGFAPREGMQVEIRAQVTLYQARGEFQLVVEAMRQAGTGDLYQQFLQLKEKLQGEGLFDQARKRGLPAMPRAIGVVTSSAGAALHDVLSTLARRSPATPVFIYPSAVQGADAPARLIAAIAAAQAHGVCSVLLLVRGGGSIEDLWAFNNEQLARVIASSPIPIVSGVGHETDFTIADFVADLRAPTPTGAASLVTPDRRELLQQLSATVRSLAQAWRRQQQRREQRLDYAARLLRPPSAQWRERSLHLAALAHRLSNAFSVRLTGERHRFERIQSGLAGPPIAPLQVDLGRTAQRLRQAAQAALSQQSMALTRFGQRLHLASPQSTLARGYAIVRHADGRVVRSSAQVERGESLEVLLDNGSLRTRVEAINTPAKTS